MTLIVLLAYLLLSFAGTALVLKRLGAASGVERLSWAASLPPLLFFTPPLLLAYAELAGAPPSMAPGPLLAVQVVLVGLLWAALRARGPRRTAAGAAAGPAAGGTEPRAPVVLARGTAWLAGLTFLGAGVLLALGFPRGFEVWAYHLPIGLHIFDTGSVQPWDHAYMHTFPANMSLYAGLLLQALPERLVAVANLPFLLLTAVAVYGLGRVAGGGRDGALLAAAGITTIPVFAFSSLELGADVAAAGLLALAFLAVLLHHQREANGIPTAVLLLAGALAGLAYGFKPLHVVPAMVLGVAILVGAASRSGRPVRAMVRDGGLYALGVVVLAGPWLVRNWIELGSPVYPINVPPITDWLGFATAPDVDYSARESTQFEWVRQPLEWLAYPWIEWHFIDQNYKHSSGFGAFFAALVPLAVLAAAWRVLRPAREAGRRAVRFPQAVLLAAALVVVALWWVMNDRQPRYIMGAIVLAVPLVAPLVAEAAGRWRTGLVGVGAAACVLMLAVLASREAMTAGSQFVASSRFDRHAFYDYPQGIDSLPPGSTVLNLGPRARNYMLRGESLENRVIGFYRLRTTLEATGAAGGTPEHLRALGVTHIYTQGPRRAPLDACVGLDPVASMDRNPENGVPLEEVRTLWRVTDACASGGRQSASAR
ncbi:hypothetical protein C882_1633 [Caenispirillum salinarum AK4]|uniref:Glycosyltransferase RgtA/B/C/D-like domain-containing protein n=1 Tax=Caenispirillum salinarum AK4 TaxID=1238182 RepID=K9H3F1_9PROT|nr:hypothetical protein [Caenispirillum salinarum]EKV32795.1 hypothetical protein C882_1633 [Caenispirillum salinarum AK4]